MSTIETPSRRGEAGEIGESLGKVVEVTLSRATIREARDRKNDIASIGTEIDLGLWTRLGEAARPYHDRKKLLRYGENLDVELTGHRLLLQDPKMPELRFVVAKFDVTGVDGETIETDWRAAFFPHAAAALLYEGEPTVLHPGLRQGVAFRVRFGENGYEAKPRPFRDLGHDVPGHEADYITGEDWEVPTGPRVYRRVEAILRRAEPIEQVTT